MTDKKERTMPELTQELVEVGRTLTLAFDQLLTRRRRFRRRASITLAAFAACGAFVTGAIASGIGGNLQLDPAKWQIFSGGSVDNGRAEYAKAHATDGSGDSTFLVEHDAGMNRYAAFTLHEQAVAAAAGRGADTAICSAEQLTAAENAALEVLRGDFPAGASPDATRQAVDQRLARRFGSTCRGLDYAGERARFVYAGLEPESMLMPGAR